MTIRSQNTLFHVLLRPLSAVLGASLTVLAAGQAPQLTPPIQPKLAPVPTPPVVTIPGPPQGSVVSPKTITAEDAARIALLHQPQVAIARAAIQAAYGNVLQAEQLLLPTIQIDATYTRPIVTGNGRVPSFSQYGFSVGGSGGPLVTQLLFDFGRTLDMVRQAESQEHASSFGLTATEQTTVYQVKQDFYAYVQDQGQIDVAEANLKDTRDNLSLAQAKLDAGLGPPADVVTAQTNFAAATVTLINARNTASIGGVKLALDMGIDPRTPISPADVEERDIPSQDMNALVNQALKERPEIKQQEQLIRAAGYEVSVAWKASLPTIDLTASNTTNLFQGGAESRYSTVGLSLTWDPFNIVGVKGQVETARAARATAQAQLTAASLTVVSDVSQAYLNVKNAEQLVQTSTAEVANAQEGLRIAEGGFKAGVATFVTVTNAEAFLATARSDLVNAKASLELARAAMEHALGHAL